MNVLYEKEVCESIMIPNIPKKEWNGKDSFKYGVAIISTIVGNAYALATYDKDVDEKPRIIKVFDSTPFTEILAIYVVPTYMDNDVKDWDVDEQSKKAAEQIIEEAKEMEVESTDSLEMKVPENEYFFDNITNDEEAMAFIKSYNRQHKINGRIPATHESLVLRLGVIWGEQNK